MHKLLVYLLIVVFPVLGLAVDAIDQTNKIQYEIDAKDLTVGKNTEIQNKKTGEYLDVEIIRVNREGGAKEVELYDAKKKKVFCSSLRSKLSMKFLKVNSSR